jgi:hypothetical protein
MSGTITAMKFTMSAEPPHRGVAREEIEVLVGGVPETLAIRSPGAQQCPSGIAAKDGPMSESGQSRRFHDVGDMSAHTPIVFPNSGFRCQALRDHPCRAHCSLRDRGLPSA